MCNQFQEVFPMAKFDRRDFLKASGMAATAALAGWPALAAAAQEAQAPAPSQSPAQPKSAPQPAPQAPKDVTHRLARFIVATKPGDVPANVRKEATRTLLNWLAVAVGGCRHPTVDYAIAAVAPFSGPPQASVLGRKERFDIQNTTLINAISSHVFDFDDTHLKTIIHISGPVISPCLALAEYKPVSGKDFLNAVIMGIETAFRVGNAVYPNHYDVGWHITGTAGVIGAGAAAGKLLGLNEQQMVWALGLAASQPVGLRESFGSMNKSFNPGRAGQNGLLAALLAAKNFTSSDGMLEAKRGWANTISTKQDFSQITEGLGQVWETALNTYKPFACGIVIHPIIDACIQLRNANKIDPAKVRSINLKVHPLVLELTGKKTPKVGLEGKFSVYHAAAVAVIEGKASERQFSDASVRDPKVVALRDKVTAVADPGVKEEQADVTIVMTDGRELHLFVKQAVGSVEKPMSDADLEAKLLDLAQGILSKPKAARLIETCWKVESLPQASALAKAALPTK
jgi:2-methylcitrate dehydratase PrpD